MGAQLDGVDNGGREEAGEEMKLRKKQKEAVLSWILEGLMSDEINLRALEFKPPFRISRQQVDYYRKSRGTNIGDLIGRGENTSLANGLILRSSRKDKHPRSSSNHVYLMKEDAFGYVKIGISENPQNRLTSIRTSCPQNVTMLATLKTNKAKEIESDLHKRYADKHKRGEWFNLSESDIEELITEWKNYQRDTKNSSMNISSVSTQRTLI